MLENLARALVTGTRMELYLTPKPGLVDLIDNGSHRDLSIAMMERSIDIIEDYLAEILASLRVGQQFTSQQAIAIRAEQRLYDELGTNTHKGYIFLSGMLLIAAHAAETDDEVQLRPTLSALCRGFFNAHETANDLGGEIGALDSTKSYQTHGEKARKKYNTGGIVTEAIAGYPALFEVALPAFRQAMKRHNCATTASFAMMARLMQTVDDTTTLHRAGQAGLDRVRDDGRNLEKLIAEGGDFITRLRELNREYKRLNLTIGGVADMLGIAFAYLLTQGEIEAKSDSETKSESTVPAEISLV